jgi:hypothetical protein
VDRCSGPKTRTGQGCAATIDPGGRWLLVASEGAVGLWDLAAEPRQVFLVEAPLPVRSLALDAGLRWWAAGSWDGTIRVEPLGMEVERERDR